MMQTQLPLAPPSRTDPWWKLGCFRQYHFSLSYKNATGYIRDQYSHLEDNGDASFYFLPNFFPFLNETCPCSPGRFSEIFRNFWFRLKNSVLHNFFLTSPILFQNFETVLKAEIIWGLFFSGQDVIKLLKKEIWKILASPKRSNAKKCDKNDLIL